MNVPELTRKKERTHDGSSVKAVLPQWLLKLCTPARMYWLGPLLGLLLSLPSLFNGYLLDEHVFRQNSLPQSVYAEREPWDYFNFISTEEEVKSYREQGIQLTWWSDSRFRMHFFRPVASLLHAAMFRYFFDNTVIMHAVSILLYVLLIVIVAQLYRRFSSSPAAIGIAILLFAVNDVHGFSSGWIASYNTLLCCVLGMSAFLLHDRWRQSRSKSSLVLFIITFAVALLSSEGALALGGYLFAYAWFIEQGSVKKKVCSLIPAAIVATLYLAMYFSMKLGIHYSGVYTEPSNLLSLDGVRFLVKWGYMFSSQLLSLAPLNIVMAMIKNIGFVIMLSVLAGIVLLFRKTIFGTPRIAFFFVAALLSIGLFSLGPLQDRLLLWSGMGAAGLLAELFTDAKLRLNIGQRITARFLTFNNIIVSIVLFVPTMFIANIGIETPCRTIASVMKPENTIVLNASWDIVLWYTPGIASEMKRPYPEHAYLLYAGIDSVTYVRTGKRTIEGTVKCGWFAQPEFSRLTRSSRNPFRKGDTLALQCMTAEVLEVNKKSEPVRVRFTFTDDLERFSWIQWTPAGPSLRAVPQEGEEIVLRLKTL